MRITGYDIRYVWPNKIKKFLSPKRIWSKLKYSYWRVYFYLRSKYYSLTIKTYPCEDVSEEYKYMTEPTKYGTPLVAKHYDTTGKEKDKEEPYSSW